MFPLVKYWYLNNNLTSLLANVTINLYIEFKHEILTGLLFASIIKH
jgi:hypothetical protein